MKIRLEVELDFDDEVIPVEWLHSHVLKNGLKLYSSYIDDDVGAVKVLEAEDEDAQA